MISLDFISQFFYYAFPASTKRGFDIYRMSNKIRIVNSSNIPRNNQGDDSTSAYKETGVGLKVLIVDDDKGSGESLRDIVQYRGHNVTLLDEGMKFVNRMNEENFDIIFMDYHTNDIENIDDDFDTNSIESNDSNDTHLNISNNLCGASDDSQDVLSDKDEITGTYVSKLAHECYDFNTPIFAYTGDSSEEALKDFQESNFKGVFIKPVDAQLINSFFEIIEREKEETNTLMEFSAASIAKMRRLAMKNNCFIFFRQKRAKFTKK